MEWMEMDGNSESQNAFHSLFYAIRNVILHGCDDRRWFVFFWHFWFAETARR